MGQGEFSHLLLETKLPNHLERVRIFRIAWRAASGTCGCRGVQPTTYSTGVSLQRTAACLGSAGEVDRFNEMVLGKK